MCPNCFCDWQRADNKVEGKCKFCQHRGIAVDKGPPSAEINLGAFCGPNGVTWHTDAIRPRRRRRLSTLVPGRSPPPQDHGQDRVELCRPGAYGPEA